MGDEVKITVIATGFRDQMPERRARMLNVEELPVVSVPVVAPDTWMREKAGPPAPPPAPPAPRFMSEEEDGDRAAAEEPAFVPAASRPQFAELAEEPVYTPLPRDYASDFGNGLGRPEEADDREAHTIASPLSAPAEEPERDLDVPAFMRRLKF